MLALIAASLLWVQTVPGQSDPVVPMSGRNIPVSDLTMTSSGQCDHRAVSVDIPVDAAFLAARLAGAEHVVEPRVFDLTSGGRYPVRVIPRCRFDGGGVEVVILFTTQGREWSRQAIELDWSGAVIEVGEAWPVDPDHLRRWFE